MVVQLKQEVNSLAKEKQDLQAAVHRWEQQREKRVFLVDQPDYEDRVRVLLQEMEDMTQKHQQDLHELRY